MKDRFGAIGFYVFGNMIELGRTGKRGRGRRQMEI